MQRRNYRGTSDLRAMQDAAQRIWSPQSRWHIGDLAWSRFMHVGREPEWPTALWTDGDGGKVHAWGWVELPGHLDLLVDPARAELAGPVLDWSDEVAHDGERTATVLDTERHLRDALAAAGYRPRTDGPVFAHCWMSLRGDLPEPNLPAGFTVSHVESDEVERRVRVHQAAFSPSRVTVESYRTVAAAWPYRAELDWVIDAPNGEFAAFALGWLDVRNAVGELEPVGVHPSHRGRGLGRAVSLAALHALKASGAQSAVVYPRADEGHPVPARLYRGIGFLQRAHTITYTRHQTAVHGQRRRRG